MCFLTDTKKTEAGIKLLLRMLTLSEKPDVITRSPTWRIRVFKNHSSDTMGFLFYARYFPLQTKTTLRHYYRDLRRQIYQEKKCLASQSIIKIFFNISNIFHQKKIAVYLAHDGELDLQPLIQQLWQQEYTVFLPVVDEKTQRLKFANFTATTPMKKNVYDIEEPHTDFFVIPQDMDIVLMPLVAFDKNGARLGMGKGYYDKSFAFRGDSRKPLLIGVAYACQESELLPKDKWDVPLDAALTEKEYLFFGKKT